MVWIFRGISARIAVRDPSHCGAAWMSSFFDETACIARNRAMAAAKESSHLGSTAATMSTMVIGIDFRVLWPLFFGFSLFDSDPDAEKKKNGAIHEEGTTHDKKLG